MRKALVSLGAGPQTRLLKLAARTMRPYAERHGYDLHLHTEPLDTTRPAPWSKIVALQRLQDDYDALLWLDADLMVVDGRRDVLEDLPGDRFQALVEHARPDGSAMPNSGVWLLRTGAECRAFLDEVWEQEDLVEHQWWENAAILRLLGYSLDPPQAGPPTRWRDGTWFLDPRWNSIRDAPAAQPYIRHYPGYKLRTRTAFMLRDLITARR